jgi:hypothetical protein
MHKNHRFSTLLLPHRIDATSIGYYPAIHAQNLRRHLPPVTLLPPAL